MLSIRVIRIWRLGNFVLILLLESYCSHIFFCIVFFLYLSWLNQYELIYRCVDFQLWYVFQSFFGINIVKECSILHSLRNYVHWANGIFWFIRSEWNIGRWNLLIEMAIFHKITTIVLYQWIRSFFYNVPWIHFYSLQYFVSLFTS